MMKSKYSEYFEKCVNVKVKITFFTLILCSVTLIGCAGSDKAVTFLLQEESVVDGETVGQAEDSGEYDTAGAILGTAKTKSDDQAYVQSETNDEAANTELGDTSATDTEMGNQNLETVYVHVCGAVISPGVVEVVVGSRVEDALVAAGGFREDAAIDYVNLAAKVADGQQVYFPTEEEVEALTAENGGLIAGTENKLKQSTQEQNGKVNINTAGIELLCTLPGIGEARAQDIIDYREANGAFQNVEGIMQVPGIKQNAYEKLRDKITVN